MAFPTSPSNDDLHTEFGRTYRYVSETNSWTAATTPAPENVISTVTAFESAADLPLVNNNPGDTTFVAEDNSFRLWTGNGWFEIALANTAPTITAGANASYTLNSDGTPTVITMSATDPEGTPIIWAYQVTSGSLEDTSITNVGGEFTITPGTTDATFDLTFTASDGINIDTSASSFTLAFAPDWSTVTLLHTLNNPNFGPDYTFDYFGSAVAIDGNYAVVAALYEDTSGTADDAGAAYIFNAATGTLLHYLTHPNVSVSRGIEGNMGWSVAIKGNYAAVGASYDASVDNATGSGSVYVYNVTTGALLYTLTRGEAYGRFGVSVSISDSHIIVGSHVGAYIYNLSDGSLLHALSNPNVNTTSTADYFGMAVAIDGNYAVVGAPYEEGSLYGEKTNAGQAYLFNVTTGAKLYNLQPVNDSNTVQAGAIFGSAVAISGDYCIVGAPNWDNNPANVGDNNGRVFVFSASTGARLHTIVDIFPAASMFLGSCLSTDGSVLVAGGGIRDIMYLYDLSDGSLINTINNPNSYGGAAGDDFGTTVSISGNKLIVGAKRETSAEGMPGIAYILQAG